MARFRASRSNTFEGKLRDAYSDRGRRGRDRDDDDGGGSGGGGGGGSSSGGGGGGEESVESEVDRAKRLGEVAASLSETSKDKDFGRQRTIEGERFGRDRQAAAEDQGFATERSRLGSSLRRDESSQEDKQQRGRMELGSSLELRQRNNALSTAMSVLNRFR